MNKKFLSAILFGALMVTSTGTFVSCKDYDDDIENLQEQINKLATKEDMTSQIASLQSALTAAQGEAAAAKATAAEALDKANSIAATATGAEKAAAEAEKAAAKAALDAAAAKEEAIKAAQEEVAKAQKALQEAIAADFEAVKKDLAAQIAKLTEKVEAMTGYTTEMLTSLHILSENGYDAALDLNYARATKKAPIGGKGIEGSFEIAAGEVNTVMDNMLVNIAPVNSVVTSDMLSLVNGKGGNLNEYLDVTVADYDSQIIKGRAAGNGLRLVSVQLKKDVDFEAFDKLVLADGQWHDVASDDCEAEHDYIAYALAVTDAAKARTITSGYDVTMHVMAEPASEAGATLASSAVNWAKKDIALYPGKDQVGADEESFPIILGEDFEVNVFSATENGHIMASYVTVDLENEFLSVTDKAAIKAMTFTGVDKIVKNGVHAVSADGTYAAGVVVPMKLVAYDYYGNATTIPFAIKAEKAAEQTASFTLTPAGNVEDGAAWTPSAENGDSELQAFTIPTAAAKYVIELIAGETEHGRTTNEFVADLAEFDIKSGIVAGNNNVLKLYNANKKPASAIKDVAYAEFVGTLNLQLMKEDKTYAGFVTFYDKTGSFLQTNAIEVTKVLPTTVPADFIAKTNAINNGVLTIYPVPAGDMAEFDLNNAFNNENWANFKIEVAKASNVDNMLLNINPAVINDGKTYPTTITYNYGDIKYKAEGHGVANDLNCSVKWGEVLSTKFGCLPVDSKYEWYVTPKVYYRESVLLEAPIYDKNGAITGYNDVIKVTDPYAKVINAFSNLEANGWAPWAKALPESATIELWTNGDKNKVNEFFTAEWKVANGKTGIQLTKTSTEVVLTGDVEITVVLNITDEFGHEHQVKALTFTMKKDHSGDAK